MFFDELERLMINHQWELNNLQQCGKLRKNQYSISVGYTCHWAKPGKPILPTREMIKNPSIYNECKKLFPNFEFESVIINKNFLCPPHKDTNNIGDSIIVGLGDYTGGDLIIEDEPHCILYSPLIFNGSENTHWTAPFLGDRYSVVLCKTKFKQFRPLNFNIVIPSFNRYNIFKNKTFLFLQKHNLLSNATLFLQNDQDEELYKEFNIKIIRSPPGLHATINFIWDYYPIDTKLWLLHDDVSKFITLDNTEPTDLPNIITGCFNSMNLHNANLCGFYPTANTYFMSNAKELTTDCRFIHDPCCLLINKRIYSTPELMGKCDFERTILYFKRDHTVLRFNHFAPVTSYNPKKKGGVGFRDPKTEQQQALLLKTTYPEYVQRIITHKKGGTSLVLKTPRREI
jgi:hypothetical protein